MSVAEEREVYIHGRDRTFTQDEYEKMVDELVDAFERDDDEEVIRLTKIFPAEPDILRAFAKGFGKGAILEFGFDMTEANMKFGEGWLDEFKP